MPVNSSISQSQRSLQNPLNLGSFNQTAIRYLKGTLGPLNQVIQGGYGGGTYNHWFKVSFPRPAWIIVTKGPPRPKYINVGVYHLDKVPIQGLAIFDKDSITDGTTLDGQVYYPYLDTVMATTSEEYRTIDILRLDRGDDRYFPLPAGEYLICVSSTRNERLDYEVAVVIEFPIEEIFFELEEGAFVFLQETAIDFTRTINVGPIVSVDTVVSPSAELPNGFTDTVATIQAGVTVTVLPQSTWLISTPIPARDIEGFKFIIEIGDDAYYQTVHDHSLSEWRNSWIREHKQDDPFPEVLIPLTNRP